MNAISSSTPTTNESQTRVSLEIPGNRHMKQIGHQKNHIAIVTEASSLNKALTKTTAKNKPTVTPVPVASEATRIFGFFAEMVLLLKVGKLVEQRGIEPLTSALRTRRSAKLSYCPTGSECKVSGFKFQV